MDFRSFCGLRPLDPLEGSALGTLQHPRPPAGKGNDLCMSAWHHYKPNKLLVVVVWGGGSHKIFTNREGDQQFFCCFQGGIKNLAESFNPSLPHPPPPRELKNDNSLIPSLSNECECPNFTKIALWPPEHPKIGKHVIQEHLWAFATKFFCLKAKSMIRMFSDLK